MTLIYISYLTSNGRTTLKCKMGMVYMEAVTVCLIYTSIVENVINDGLGACLILTVLNFGVQTK